METLVLRVVDQISDDDAASESPTYCTTPDCRQDVACFVLNRVPQRYVNSARGEAHVDGDLTNDLQLRIDVVTLVHEGLRRVTSIRRSYYDEDTGNEPVQGPAFRLPIIKGRLFNGLDFQPITDVAVRLLANDALLTMIDNRWSNPYVIPENTPATYIFLPRPLPANHAGERKEMELEIRVEDPQYEPFHHFFKLEVSSKPVAADLLDTTSDLRVPDLYLLPAV
jgi:competence protein ComFB